MIELKQVLLHHIDEAIRGDEEAIKFIGGFVKNIPGEVLDVEIDESAVGKQALKIIPLVGCGAGDRFIRIQPCEFPFFFRPNVTGVIVYLGGKGIQLVG